MQVRRIRLTIEYDPDWPEIAPSALHQYLSDEREQWMRGEVNLQDLELSATPYTFTVEKVA